MERYVIACNPHYDHAHLLDSTQTFSCIRPTAADVAKLPWRARALLDGMDTLDIANFPSLGALGCSLSHIALWRRLANSNKDAMIIFEDDARLRRSKNVVEDVIEAAATAEFDILLLGWRLPLDTALGPQYEKIEAPDFFKLVSPRFYETHAYVITRKAALLLLQEALPPQVQIDAYMGEECRRRQLRVITPRCKLVAQRRSILDSSVQNQHLMSMCASCRLPQPLRSGWASGVVSLVIVMLALSSTFLILANRRQKLGEW